jgi:hypothetical protein
MKADDDDGTPVHRLAASTREREEDDDAALLQQLAALGIEPEDTVPRGATSDPSQEEWMDELLSPPRAPSRDDDDQGHASPSDSFTDVGHPTPTPSPLSAVDLASFVVVSREALLEAIRSSNQM